MTKTIVGLSGYARSGKDTIADYLVLNHGFRKMSFAAPMRDSLYALNPMVGATKRLVDVIDEFGWDGYKESPWGVEMRELMQRFGTEVGRNLFGQNFWIEQALSQVMDGEKVVFADVRFPNEADAVIASGGPVVRVTRGDLAPANAHISEHALDDYDFTERIDNGGSLDDLYAKAKNLVAVKELI